MQHQDVGTHAPQPIAEAIAHAASRAVVAWPEHGRPRSIDLDATPRALSASERTSIASSGRTVRVVAEKDCDANGLFRVDSFQDLVWGSEGISEDNDWLRDLANGDRMGWATMESRCTLFELPKVGSRVQSFSAPVEMSRKAQHERFWVYDIDRDVLLCSASFVDVAFNINTRRAIEIPDFERERIEGVLRADLA